MADPATNTTYPNAIDSLPTVGPNDKQNAPGLEHDVIHDRANAILNVLQALVGTTADSATAPTVLGMLAAIDEALASYLSDAPMDGATYGRKAGAWSPVLGGSRAPNVQSITSTGTVTPTFDNDIVTVTQQAAALTLANPTGTAINGLGLVIRIKDNGTSRGITYGTQYRPIGVTLPAATVVGKTLYLAMIYNATDTTWDIVAVGQQT